MKSDKNILSLMATKNLLEKNIGKSPLIKFNRETVIEDQLFIITGFHETSHRCKTFIELGIGIN